MVWTLVTGVENWYADAPSTSKQTSFCLNETSSKSCSLILLSSICGRRAQSIDIPAAPLVFREPFVPISRTFPPGGAAGKSPPSGISA